MTSASMLFELGNNKKYTDLYNFSISRNVSIADLTQFIESASLSGSDLLPACCVAQAILMRGVMHWPAILLLAIRNAASKNFSEMRGQCSQLEKINCRRELDGVMPNQYPAPMKLLIYWLVQAYKRGDTVLAVNLVEILKSVHGDVDDFVSSEPSDATIGLGSAVEASPRRLRFTKAVGKGDHRRKTLVLGMRSLMFPERQNTRELDLPARIVDAFRGQGWNVVFHPMDYHDIDSVKANVDKLVFLCRENNAGLCIVDFEASFCDCDVFDPFVAIRRDTAVVMFHGDPWKLEVKRGIMQRSPFVDGFWSINPSIDVWSEPELVGKSLFFPLPDGGYKKKEVHHKDYGLSFIGGVELYNWTRAVWLTKLDLEGIDVDVSVSSHASDSMTAIQSYHNYLDRIGQKSVSLNFSIRSEFSRTLTGRTFEAIAAGSLLVQESTADLDYYFVRSDQYLSFKTLGDVIKIYNFLESNPHSAEAIRRSATTYMTENYSDECIVSYFEHFMDGVERSRPQ